MVEERTGRGTNSLALAALAMGLLAACGAEEAPSAAAPAPAAAPTPSRIAAPAPDRPLGPKVFPVSAAPVLDDPGRDEWQMPEKVIAALAIRPGERTADIGCGTGYFTLRLLRATGPTGRVLAVDVQQGMLDLLGARLRAEEKSRVDLRRSAADRPLQPGDRVDLALCANTLLEVDEADLPRFVRSMADGLAPGGRLAVVDWLPERTRLGPPPEHRISPGRIRELAEAAGLTLRESHGFLPMHSFQVFGKGETSR